MDDILLAARNETKINKVKRELSLKFDIKDLAILGESPLSRTRS